MQLRFKNEQERRKFSRVPAAAKAELYERVRRLREVRGVRSVPKGMDISFKRQASCRFLSARFEGGSVSIMI